MTEPRRYAKLIDALIQERARRLYLEQRNGLNWAPAPEEFVNAARRLVERDLRNMSRGG